MLVNDFLDICDVNTKYFVRRCLSIGYTLTSNKDLYPEEYRIRYKGTIMNSNAENTFFIFLYVFSFMQKAKMLDYDIDLSWFTDKIKDGTYHIPSRTKEVLNYFLNDKRSLNTSELDYAFYNSIISSYLRTNINFFKRVAVLERIINSHIMYERINKDYYGIPKDFCRFIYSKAVEKEQNPNIFKYHSTGDLLNIPCGTLLTSTKFEFNPLIGREKELRKLQALLMDEEKSVIIYGNPGTGKTALVKGLAYDIQHGKVGEKIQDKKIIEISASELISGCRYVGMVEQRLLDIINPIIAAKDSILFIDEIHTLMGLGQGANSQNDVSNILKPYLGDGRLKIIGATTLQEYLLIKENGAFSRRFNNLELSDLTDEDVLNILKVNVDRFKTKHKISLAESEERKMLLLNEILNLSKQVKADPKAQRYNPDLSLSLLRLCYDYALLDGKECIDTGYIIEGVNNSDSISDELKEQFAQRLLRL